MSFTLGYAYFGPIYWGPSTAWAPWPKYWGGARAPRVQWSRRLCWGSRWKANVKQARRGLFSSSVLCLQLTRSHRGRQRTTAPSYSDL